MGISSKAFMIHSHLSIKVEMAQDLESADLGLRRILSVTCYKSKSLSIFICKMGIMLPSIREVSALQGRLQKHRLHSHHSEANLRLVTEQSEGIKAQSHQPEVGYCLKQYFIPDFLTSLVEVWLDLYYISSSSSAQLCFSPLPFTQVDP